MGNPTTFGPPPGNCCTSSDARNCSVAASSPMSFTGLHGTPPWSSAASHSARLLVRMTAAIIGMSSVLFFTRAALRANLWSVAHSGWPSTSAQRAHSRSLPGARQSGRSAVSKVW
jgi:hypothetical protein